MRLGALIKGMEVKETTGDMEAAIKAIRYNSRQVGDGDLFAALRGGRVDGHAFIGEAAAKGAAAVLKEGPCSELSLPCVSVEDSRDALAYVSHAFYGRPSHSLLVTGITGTNGKTTTSYILKSILEAAGLGAGLIGTIRYMVGDGSYPAPYTTPEAPEFQGLLRSMLDEGCAHVVAEVSSHALAQRRVDHTVFGAAVFTNLTGEHLDFHRDMQEYFGAKRRLFDELLSGTAVINADDPWGRKLASSINKKTITYAIESDADLRARDIESSPGGISFRLSSGGADCRIESPLMGMINVYNILAASGAARALDLAWGAIVEGVKSLQRVEGRFQRVEAGQDFLCVVDFAHTGDALERLILTARGITPGRVITVFGCGGDRDRSKRPVMGRAATRLSDLVLVTSDNPRSEDPLEIIREVVSGAEGSSYRVVPDRREAIALAVSEARAGDTVLIAGKGHEEYQEIKGRRARFSDREAAEEAIKTVVRKRKGG